MVHESIHCYIRDMRPTNRTTNVEPISQGVGGFPNRRHGRGVGQREIRRLTTYLRVRIVVEQGHWLWVGYVDQSGYGRAHRYDVPRLAHREVWRELFGEVPAHLHHRCHVRHCVRPHRDHVVPMPTATAHRQAHRDESTRCSHGHEWTEANTYWRASGQRQCRACKAATEGRRRARQKS